MTVKDTPRSPALVFLQHEAAGGIILLAFAIAALVAANSPLAAHYDALFDMIAGVRIGPLALEKPLLLWINDGLMAVFFFLMGLEIKRELLVGELSTPTQAMLPAIAAAGGMLVPALIYVAINSANPVALRGWAIPAATDIAFAVGVLALLGNRVPSSLRIFLLALAIIDDLGAIIIIALFYTEQLSVPMLALAAVGAIGLALLNRRDVSRPAPYLLIGLVMWVCVLKSGVHATLAGVVTALAIPLGPVESDGGHKHGLLHRLEAALQPWVTFLVLPLFAFANAGVSLAGVSIAKLAAPIPLGIALGLFAGKQLGIFAATWATVKAGWSEAPVGASWQQVYGVCVLGGIGFTMSLFIGMLAFPDPGYAADIRIGVLAGSLLSALVGYGILRWGSGESRDNRA